MRDEAGEVSRGQTTQISRLRNGAAIRTHRSTFPKSSIGPEELLGLWVGEDASGQNKVTKARKKRHGAEADYKTKAKSFCDHRPLWGPWGTQTSQRATL